MEKSKPEETYRKTALSARKNAGGSDERDLIVSMIREMPRIDPPAGLLSAVMQAVRQERVSAWLRVYRWVTSPRSLNFTPLRLVAATALSALLVFSAFSIYERDNRDFARKQELIPVEFALDMPDAHSVHVVGSFNNWVPQPCKLHKDNGSTRWTLNLRLNPGRYEYAFLVDGKHIRHPHAEFYRDDGFGNQNTVLALGKEDDV
jgi:hypothetical protein